MDILDYDTENKWSYENGFYLTSDITRMGKMLAHYELYKMISGLPGHVIELGVFKGASLIRFATYQLLLESPFSRKIIGFDMFGRFPVSGDETDQAFAYGWQADLGNGIGVDDLTRCFEYKGFKSYEFVEGDILKTLPEYIRNTPALRVSMLHIDTDLYAPAKLGLDLLWDRIVPGGLLVLDDYGTEAGGTRAVDDFFIDKNIKIYKLPISHASPCYIIK